MPRDNTKDLEYRERVIIRLILKAAKLKKERLKRETESV